MCRNNHETKVCRWRKFYLNFDRKIIDPKTVVVASLCLVLLPGGVGLAPRCNLTLFENTLEEIMFTEDP